MLRNWIVSLLVNSLVLIVVAGYLDSFYLESVTAALIASIILAMMNILVKPILVFLTLPITFLTLGLFLIVINAVTLMLTALLMGEAFIIDSFSSAVLASIIIGLLNVMIQKLVIEPLQNKSKR
jgi:putative membrane protein